MNRLILLLLLPFLVTTVFAQSLKNNVELKEGRAAGTYGTSRLGKAPKKIYINQFRIFYQVVYFDSDYARAGYDPGLGHRSSAKANLAIGINGLSEQALNENTNRLYNEYIDQLKAAGFEIISADQAADINAFEGWELREGGLLNRAQAPGFIMATPQNYQYYVKRVKDSGKEKGTFLSPNTKISTQLGGVVVVDVSLQIPFMVEAESGASKMLKGALGGVAKVVAEPSFRLEEYNAKISYQYGMQTTLNCPLKKDVEIEGVFEKKKYKASAVGEHDQVYESGAWIITISAEEARDQNVQFISCEEDRYIQGAYSAASQYLKAGAQQLIGYTK